MCQVYKLFSTSEVPNPHTYQAWVASMFYQKNPTRRRVEVEENLQLYLILSIIGKVCSHIYKQKIGNSFFQK